MCVGLNFFSLKKKMKCIRILEAPSACANYGIIKLNILPPPPLLQNFFKEITMKEYNVTTSPEKNPPTIFCCGNCKRTMVAGKILVRSLRRLDGKPNTYQTLT